MLLRKSQKYLWVLALLLWAGSASAQISSSSIAVNITPPNPAPGENTTVTLSSYVYNLDTVSITWFLNGANASSGIGKKSFSLTAPQAGKESAVTARIKLPEGDLDVRVTVRPNNMTLLWEATDSYVPPFYRGKALPVADSEIKIVAIPEIKSGASLVNPKNLTYSWKRDYGAEQGASGFGKNSFTYVNDYLEDASVVGVVASTLDQSSSSETNITVNTFLPEILFYKKDAVFGTRWEHTINDGYLIKNEDILVAIPYFIAPRDIRRPDLRWTWSINGVNTPVEDFSRQNMLPLRVEEGISGTAKVNLQIENLYKIFQSANKEIDVQF